MRVLSVVAALAIGAHLSAAQAVSEAGPVQPASLSVPATLGKPVAETAPPVAPQPVTLGRPVALEPPRTPEEVVRTVAIIRGSSPDLPVDIVSSEPELATSAAPPLLDETTAPVPEAIGGEGPALLDPSAPAGQVLQGCTAAGEVFQRFWIRGEYLLWAIKAAPLPAALVTSGSVTDAQPGGLGQPHTQVLFGTQHLDTGAFSGGRLTAGLWFTTTEAIGIEGSGFLLQQANKHFAVHSDANGFPLLVGRPISTPFGIDAVQSSFPGKVTGGIAAGSHSQLWGADGNLTGRIYRGEVWSVNWLAGVRYLDLREGLTIADSSQVLPGQSFGVVLRNGQIATLEGNSGYAISDSFQTRNQFYGGQAGVQARFGSGRLTLDLRTKVALGESHETRTIGGSNTLFLPGQPPAVFSGGSLTNPGGNIGRVGHDTFAVVPEFGVNIGYAVTTWMRLFAGYNFLYWSNVARPGNQITLNGATAQTVPPLVHSDFWAQGATFGAEFTW